MLYTNYTCLKLLLAPLFLYCEMKGLSNYFILLFYLYYSLH